MKKLGILFVFAILLSHGSLFSQNPNRTNTKKNKNVILLIPDGASVPWLALTRWYNNNQPLAIDPILCGLVKTNNIDDRFPDSAPTSTAYATGIKSNKKHIGVDSASVPHISILELAKLNGQSTGIVVTCEFPHATPADFVCHYNERDSYKNLAKQFIYNSPTIVFAGGKSVLDELNYNEYLKDENIKLIQNRESFSSINLLPKSNEKIWGLFSDWNGNLKSKSFECDREATEPSLSEMTNKAIEILSQNKNGFFMMVEGSQVDWACHSNDPYAAVTDFLEFNRAVGIALDFAKKDSNTIVIVCPDHGNGGISIGNAKSNGGTPFKYDKLNIKEQVIAPLKQVKCSGRKYGEMVVKNPAYINADSIKKYCNTDVSEDTLKILNNIINSSKNNNDKAGQIQNLLGLIFSAQNFIGWTTNGHTAEDVFLAIYAPEGVSRLNGVVDNSDIGKYIASQMDFGDLNSISEDYYSLHRNLFKDGEVININQDSIEILRNERKLTLYSNSSKYKIVYKNKAIEGKLPLIAVCIKNDDKILNYYFPKSIVKLFE